MKQSVKDDKGFLSNPCMNRSVEHFWWKKVGKLLTKGPELILLTNRIVTIVEERLWNFRPGIVCFLVRLRTEVLDVLARNGDLIRD
jgi:hypothetical protein